MELSMPEIIENDVIKNSEATVICYYNKNGKMGMEVITIDDLNNHDFNKEKISRRYDNFVLHIQRYLNKDN